MTAKKIQPRSGKPKGVKGKVREALVVERKHTKIRKKS